VFPILLPPLRDRKDDIAPLVEHFSRLVSEINAWKPKAFAPEAIDALTRHSWPGNVRELRNVVERLLLLADEQVDEETARMVLPQLPATARSSGTLAVTMENFERETIHKELERCRHNMTEAARALGLERSHLYKKCSQLGIDVKGLRKADD
jgi:two-component system nitrogen regulation response regulator NtrX